MTISTATLRAQLLDCLRHTKASPHGARVILTQLTTLPAIARFAEALLASPGMSESEMLRIAAKLLF